MTDYEGHIKHAKRVGVSTPCTAGRVNYGGGCLNCGWKETKAPRKRPAKKADESAIRNNQWSRDQINHPLNTPPGKTCRKCGSQSVSLPAYNGDYFDCLDCGHSWETTSKQLDYMKRNPASMFNKDGRIRRQESAAEAIAGIMLGETVVTNDRVLNHALNQAGEIIGRRDISAIDKFEMLAAYVLKARREVLGKPEA